MDTIGVVINVVVILILSSSVIFSIYLMIAPVPQPLSGNKYQHRNKRIAGSPAPADTTPKRDSYSQEWASSIKGGIIGEAHFSVHANAPYKLPVPKR